MADELDSTVPDAPSKKGLSRRQMIRASAVAGAAAWSAPVIIDSLTSPAAAFTAPPCPNVPGNYYAIVYSPSTTHLEDRDPNGTGYGPVSLGTCDNIMIPSSGSGSVCRPPAGYGHTFAGSILLHVDGVNISHDITNQLNGEDHKVTIKLDAGSCCHITGVKAFVHKFQSASTGSDCPPEYCQQAMLSNGSSDASSTDLLRYLPVSNKEWQVWTNSNPNLCSANFPNPGDNSGNGSNVGIHWGSPNQDMQCVGFATGAKSVGQSLGYMLITLACDPGFVPNPNP